MIYLNFSNIEELIFHDRNAQSLLPVRYFSLFEQWRLSKQIPFLRQLGKHAVLDLLNQLTEEQIESLELYFNDRIVIEKLNYSTAKNLKIPLSKIDACQALCEVEGFMNFSTWRDQNFLYLSFWR